MRKLTLAILAMSLCCSCAVLTTRSSDKPDSKYAESIDYTPKGRLDTVFHSTSVPGPSKRRMLVYLPCDYNGERLPVVYFIHGARGNETSWITDGHILRTVDNLWEEGKASRCIIVMPNMNQYNDDKDAADSRFKAPVESLFEVDGSVETGFVRDVVATVDSLYNTIPDKAHRAIAGLSVGAMQAIHISSTYPEEFDYIGLFSPFFHSAIKPGPDSKFYRGLARRMKTQFQNPPKVYAMYIGQYDFYKQHVDFWEVQLNHLGYPHTLTMTSGGHSWRNWEKYSRDFLQRLF